MPYEPCYISRESKRIGGIFISADGSRRTIPDIYLNNATLDSDSTLLRLSYSSCTVDISGYRLYSIYKDVVSGRLGTVTVQNPADAESYAFDINPIVTGIVFINMSPDAAFDMERKDA